MIWNQRLRPLVASRALASLTLLAVLSAGCASGPPPAAESSAGPAERPPVSVRAQTDWREAILYFVIVDRFADGDRANNAGVDRAAKGAFHGGDLRGLRQQLGELAELGVTALWITLLPLPSGTT